VSKSPKILTLDIETAPIESYTWGLWEQNVGLDMIKTDWSILAYCAKWLGKPKLVYEDMRGWKKQVRDDRHLMQGIWDLLDEADIVIGQNVRRFDLKKINARLITSGFGPYSPVRVVDTLDVAKKHFAFSSNKLAFTSLYLTDTPKSEHKKFPGFALWAECLQDNAEAWKEMEKYNKRDVVATEKLYLKFRPWIQHHPNLAVYTGPHHGHVCPACGSAKTQSRGIMASQVFKYQRYQCTDCGHWSKERLRIKE
jgi:hypothetical protein